MVKLQVREKESIQEAVRRFRKIVEEAESRKKCDAGNTMKNPAKPSVGPVSVPSVATNVPASWPVSLGPRFRPDLTAGDPVPNRFPVDPSANPCHRTA